jgi:hypothetical protein
VVCPRWGHEGAVTPQLPLPPASGLLSCLCLQAHIPSPRRDAGAGYLRIEQRELGGGQRGTNGPNAYFLATVNFHVVSWTPLGQPVR